MADQSEPKARYPKQEVAEGQKHGYIGDVEIYDPAEAEAGHTNVKTQVVRGDKARDPEGDKPVKGTIGVTQDANAE